MSKMSFSTECGLKFGRVKIVFAADANMPQTWPHICRIFAAYLPQSCRKYGRKPSVDRMACEPANLPKTITDMPVKNVPPQALLASFLRGAICTQMINPLPLF